MDHGSGKIYGLKNAGYTYDSQNRLTQVQGEGKKVTYRYDGDGLLYERTEGDETTRYYYDDEAKLIAEASVSASGKPETTYIYVYDLNGELKSRLDKKTGKLQYYQLNGHGDVIGLVDADSNTLNSYTYDIWGGPLTEEETVPNVLRYSGEYWDNTTGLQYLRARWYDPGTARFMGEDTYKGELSDPLSLNLYTYVANNPLIYSDPSGHDHQFNQNQYNYLTYLFEHGSLNQARWADQQLEDGRYYIDKATPNEVLTLSEAIRADANAREDYLSEFVMDTVISAGVDGIVIKAGRSAGKSLISQVKGLFTKSAAVEVGFHTGKAGEQYLAATLGSTQTQVFFRTSLGRRFVDVLDSSGVAHESKVGAVTLTALVRSQILKDAELIRTGQVQDVIWHFYRSGVTREVGPNQSVINFLNQNGIRYVIEQVFK